MTTASTPSTKSERRAEQRRVNTRDRKITKRAKDLRAMYRGLDDLDVPPAREIVDRYSALRAAGWVPADGNELEGVVAAGRRRHSPRNSNAAIGAAGMGVLALGVYMLFFSAGADQPVAVASDVAAYVWGAVVLAAIVIALEWGAGRTSEQELSVVLRAHADALLSKAEAEAEEVGVAN